MTTKPDMTRVWAEGAPGGNIEDPDVTSPGKFDAGWLAEIPPFENFNFLQKLFTQSAAYLNEQGIGVYDAITDYPVGGIAKGSDGNLYTTLVINGPATSVVDPVGDTTATWKPTALLEQLLTSTLIHNMSSDADYTLSVGENYKGRIIITDTSVNLTAARNIIVADTERSFFVKNETLQDLTFKTSAGTGITIPTGGISQLLSDGTNVVSLEGNQAPSTGIGSIKGLVGINNTTNPNFQFDIDADESILIDIAGIVIRNTAINLTVDITASGVNGLDTGSEASDTWYHIWLISNGTTIAALLSLSDSAPTMPSGYTFKNRIGAIYNDASSNFIAIRQIENVVSCHRQLLNGGATTSAWTGFSTADFIPTTAKFQRYQVGTQSSVLGMSPLSDGRNGDYGTAGGGGGGTFGGIFSVANIVRFNCHIQYLGSTVYYYLASATSEITVEGWEF